MIIERARLQLLPWGPGPYLDVLCKRHPAGFDVVLGADVVYQTCFVGSLLHSVKKLLAPHPQVPALSSEACSHLDCTKQGQRRAVTGGTGYGC